jgi:hypothetical protein
MRDNLYLKIFKILIKKVLPVILLILLNAVFLSGAVIKQQVNLAPNNISTWIWNTGVFNQDLRVNNTPGFEWPKASGKFAIFTSGLSIGAYINGQLRMGNASYNGEYAPGYVFDSLGTPLFKTDSRFKLLSVKYNDNIYNNSDVLKWKDMIPYGAPFDDKNLNKIYDEGIDKPGMPDAGQTVFVCITDADPSNHTTSEGFSGGTLPLYAEIHLTAWGYQFGDLSDAQFLKWDIINKNNAAWEKTYFTIFNDPDLGDADDDYIGCDSAMKIAYSCNSDNQDGNGLGRTYGTNPPAAGLILLRGPVSKTGISNDSIKMSSVCYFTGTGSPGPVCEQDPSSSPIGSYNYMKGIKRDGTPWLNPTTVPPFVTKFCYNGDPEAAAGWTEYKGRIRNCGGNLYGEFEPSPPGDRRILLNAGSDFLNVNPGDTQRIVIAQAVGRGTDNKNSVTKLKETLNFSRRIYYQLIENQETYYIEPPAPLPQTYKLYQNYPNPFNPVTTIKYDMKKLWKVKIEVYDMRGELISTLVNEEKPQGSYEVKFDASNLPSGIYFIKMISGGGFEDSKKMVVIK